MVTQKDVIGAFKHAESKSGLIFGLLFVQTHNNVLLVFRITPSFWVKLGSQIFRNIRPWQAPSKSSIQIYDNGMGQKQVYHINTSFGLCDKNYFMQIH